MPPKLLHSSMIGWGSIAGLAPTRPTPMGLIGLPMSGTTLHSPTSDATDTSTSTNFHHSLIAISAGTKHICALTSAGNIISMGSNRYGQAGQPVMSVASPSLGDTKPGGSSATTPIDSEQLPFFYDLGYEDVRKITATSSQSNSQKASDDSMPTHVTSGCNHNLFYRPGTTNVITFGNNNWGQLGLGHKQQSLNTEGFAEWDRTVPWATKADASSGIKEIVCGQMHTMIHFNSGAVYGCGSNMCGELGLNDINIDGAPRLVHTADLMIRKGNPKTGIKQIACGVNFTLFLTNEGRVFGTGSDSKHQLPALCKVPTPFPIHRAMFSLGSATSSSVVAPNSSEAFASAVCGEKTTVSATLVRIKHIAATSEMSVFVTSKNELIVRGAIPEVGFSSGARFHVVLPLEADRCAQGRTFPHIHPEIVKVVARETNVLVVYADGRVVGFGCNTDGQVKISSLKVAQGGGQPVKSINLAGGRYTDEVALVLPKPASIPSTSSSSSTAPHEHLKLCIGLSFGCALDTSPMCLYEDGLVDHYRSVRDLAKTAGEAVSDVLMSELVFPQIPKDFGMAKSASSAVSNAAQYRRATRGMREVGGSSSPQPATAVAATQAAASVPQPSSDTQKSSLEALVLKRRAKLKF